MKLIPEWRHGLRLFSVQAMAVSVAIQGGWQAVPDDLKAHLPGALVTGISIGLLVLGIVGRFIDQELPESKDEPKP